MNRYLPLLLIVASSSAYHICQHRVPATVNPLSVLVISYATALLLSLGGIAITGQTMSLNLLTGSNVLLGFSVLGIELGFLLAYRMGWQLSSVPLIVNGTVACLLYLVGWQIYKEKISLCHSTGIFMVLFGLMLLQKK